jgi:hypothetical protein
MCYQLALFYTLLKMQSVYIRFYVIQVNRYEMFDQSKHANFFYIGTRIFLFYTIDLFHLNPGLYDTHDNFICIFPICQDYFLFYYFLYSPLIILSTKLFYHHIFTENFLCVKTILNAGGIVINKRQCLLPLFNLNCNGRDL